MPVVYERRVRFEEVDAAGLLFFARYFHFCHAAMERLFDPLPGGYVDLITRRRIGFPAVHLRADWKAPLRYGDAVRIDASVVKIGTTSVTFRYVLTRASDGVHVGSAEHVTVATDLVTMTKRPVPDDCRALLETHRLP